MKEYTYSEARQQLSRVLDEVVKYGEVRVKRRDGTRFTIKQETEPRSPLDVEGVKGVSVSKEEIMQSIRESRERN
jgi:PHD/YefM family antitoxin component YafN of YafNO toxin-antitoxin module